MRVPNHGFQAKTGVGHTDLTPAPDTNKKGWNPGPGSPYPAAPARPDPAVMNNRRPAATTGGKKSGKKPVSHTTVLEEALGYRKRRA